VFKSIDEAIEQCEEISADFPPPSSAGKKHLQMTTWLKKLRHIEDGSLTGCQAPSANFHFHIGDRFINIKVMAPFDLNLSEDEAKTIEDQVHNLLELLLAPKFKEKDSG